MGRGVPGLWDREDTVETRVTGETRIFSDLARKRAFRSEDIVFLWFGQHTQKKGDVILPQVASAAFLSRFILSSSSSQTICSTFPFFDVP